MDKKEAAKVLGVSVRRVETFAGEGRLGEVKYVRSRTGKKANFDPAAVESLKRELESVDAQLPTSSALAVRNPQALALAEQIAGGIERQHADAERVASLLETIAAAVTDGGGPGLAEIDLKLTLSVAEASRLCGLSKGALRGAIRAGELKAKTVAGRRGWTIKRADLDAYVKKL